MSLKSFEILNKLGEGSYSSVYKVKRITDNHIYALKKVRINQLKEKEKRNALNEVRFLASINHPNIISYKEAFFDEESRCLCLIMEFADSGDLYQRIIQYQKKGVYMSESYIWKLLIELTKGLKALHDIDILHRDLKSANVFLGSAGEVKLGDMNVSKISKDCIMHTQTGTPYYASPEVWKDVPYDSKSDMWSLGCVLYEASSLKPPFRADDMEGLYRQVTKGLFSPIPKTYSSDLQNVISSLLQVNPTQRLNCTQILSLPPVVKHMSGPSQAAEYFLLQTIKFPKNIQQISKQLPQPNYENRPVRNKSTLIPMVQREKVREKSVEKSGLNRNISELPKVKKEIFRPESQSLKLPQVRRNKNSAKDLVYKQDIGKIEKYLNKPASNRSFLLPSR